MLINNISKSFQKIVANFAGKVRHDKMEGRDYLVAPMVMMVEGVLSGTAGPILYEAKDMSAFPAAWNNKPVVVYHPGQGQSACDPDILTTQGIGKIMKARVENVGDKVALKAEAWFEESRANAVDSRIMEAVENNKPMELSTGLFVEIEPVENEEYKGIARNYQPDHLALLPDMKGACSLKDGAGFLMNEAGDKLFIDITSMADDHRSYVSSYPDTVIRVMGNRITEFIDNEMSHSNVRMLLQSLLRNTNDDLWIDEVFDTFFIYEDGGKLWKQNYLITDDSATFVGSRVEVVRVTEFRTKDGKVIGNERDQTMDKKKIVDGLIANAETKWEEADREVLMAMDDDVLNKIIGNEKEAPAAEANAAEANATETPAAEAAEAKETPDGEATGNQSVDDFIKGAPAEMQEVLTNSVRMHNETKSKVIAALVENKKCNFTPEYLQQKDLEELQNMLALAGGDKPADSQIQRFNYGGQGGTPVENIIVTGEPLVIPGVVTASAK